MFETLEYGPAPEDPKGAYAWLDAHDRKFGHFINNKVAYCLLLPGLTALTVAAVALP